MATLHIPDNDLEAYSLARLAASRTVTAEEHLLACAGCQKRLAGWDEYTRAMRAACRPFSGMARGQGAGAGSQD